MRTLVLSVVVSTLLLVVVQVALAQPAEFTRDQALANAGRVYMATSNRAPGAIVQMLAAGFHDPAEGLRVVYTRPAGNLTSFCFFTPVSATPVAPPPARGTVLKPSAPALNFFFTNGISDKRIWRAATATPGETVVYTDREYVREVTRGPGGATYFSRSFGAGRDGVIYRLDSAMHAAVYYTVRLSQVGGFWAGNFAFNPAGVLYISNGNMQHAKIWVCPLSGTPSIAYTNVTEQPILGFCFTAARTFLFTVGSEHVRWATLGDAPWEGFFDCTGSEDKFCDVVLR